MEEALGLNLYETDFRQYDPAIARFTSIDPVTHHSQSTYTAFDNNPIYWADPSGADSETLLNDIWNASGSGKTTWTNNNDGTFSGSNGASVDCDDCPQEGATRPEMVAIPRAGMAPHKTRKEFYHAGGVNGSTAGWKSEEEYASIIKPVALELARYVDSPTNRVNGMQYTGSYDSYLAFMSSRNTVDGFYNLLISFGRSAHNSEDRKSFLSAQGIIAEDNLSTLAVFLPALRALRPSTTVVYRSFGAGELSAASAGRWQIGTNFGSKQFWLDQQGVKWFNSTSFAGEYTARITVNSRALSQGYRFKDVGKYNAISFDSQGALNIFNNSIRRTKIIKN